MREAFLSAVEMVCIVVCCSAILVAGSIYWGMCELAKAIDRKEGK